MCNVGITGLAQCVYVKHSFGRVGGLALVAVGLFGLSPFLDVVVLGLFARTCRGVQLLQKGSTGTLGFSFEHFRLVSRNFSDAVIISVVLVFAVSFNIFGFAMLTVFLGSDNHVFGEVSTCWVTQSIGSAVTNKLCVETCDTGFRLLWVVLDTTC